MRTTGKIAIHIGWLTIILLIHLFTFSFSPLCAQNIQKGDYGYLYCHMSDRGQWTAFALSRDGYHYEDVLGGGPVMDVKEHARIEGGQRDAYITRSWDGNGFVMVTTDMNNGMTKAMGKQSEWDNYGIDLLKSDDLIHWTSLSFDYRKGDAIFCDPQSPSPYRDWRTINRVWAPQIFWDPHYEWPDGDKGGYMIYYSMWNRSEEAYDRMYYSYADKTFTKLTKPRILFDWGYATIDADINYLESDGLYHMLIKKEGGKPGIYTATSEHLTYGWGEPVEDDYVSFEGKKKCEGSSAFQLIGDDTWRVAYIEYSSKPRHYRICKADKYLRNFSDPVDIEGVTGPQHGSFMRLTKAEYKRLQKWGSAPVIHRLEAEVIDGAVLHTNRFLEGYNPEVRTMNQYFTTRLKYAFMPSPDSEEARIYKGGYQGVGLGYHHLNNQIGNPVSAYLFQGATIKTLSSKLALNYEWDFGVAYGWHSYNESDRVSNHVIGSKMTAYMDFGVYLRWILSRQFDLNIGLTASHFSNGNTSMPNAGLNVASAKVSLAYYLNRPEQQPADGPLPVFQKHWSTDVVVFGGWKRRGAETALGSYTLSDTYGVVGVNINPMYNLNHWLNVGASLDLYYDHSANLKVEDSTVPPDDGETEKESASEGETGDAVSTSSESRVSAPSWYRQVTAGLSVRAEYVMPYFTINFGIGHNLINAGSAHFRGFYEILALKAALTPKVFLHIGYSLYSFQYPNNLMLGIGYRFGGRRK